MAGKGDWKRPQDKPKFDAEYDRIFGVPLVQSWWCVEMEDCSGEPDSECPECNGTRRYTEPPHAPVHEV